MARARNIKPGFFRNADLVELPFETRLLFAGLWTIADREGRLEDRPKQIKMEIFPADSLDANELLGQLASAGLIQRYEIDEKRFIQVTNFKKHQNPHAKEQASIIPEQVKPGASPVQAPVNNDANPVVDTELPVLAGLIPPSLIPDSPSLIPDPLVDTTPAATPIGSADVFVLPDWIPADTWKAYCKTRSAKKAKNEPHALGLIVADLEKFMADGHDPVEILNNSIKSGWAGVFAPRPNTRAGPAYQSIHDKRAETIAILTGKKSNERTIANEHDIAGESRRVAG